MPDFMRSSGPGRLKPRVWNTSPAKDGLLALSRTKPSGGRGGMSLFQSSVWERGGPRGLLWERVWSGKTA